MGKVEVSSIVSNVQQKLVQTGRPDREALQNAWWMLEKITQHSEVELLAQREEVCVAPPLGRFAISGQVEGDVDQMIGSPAAGFIQFRKLDSIIGRRS